MSPLPRAVADGLLSLDDWAPLTATQRKHIYRTEARAKAAGVPLLDFLQMDRGQRIQASLSDRAPSVWTEEKVQQLRQAYANGDSRDDIAVALGINPATVNAAASRFGIRRRDHRAPRHVREEFNYLPQDLNHRGHGSRRFYVYAYLRTDGTPHYIGKGTGRRAWQAHTRPGPKGGICDRTPRDPNRIRLLAVGLTNSESLSFEQDLISILGRVEDGGCLFNFTDGGESPNHSPRTRRRLSTIAKARGIPRSTIEAAARNSKLRQAEKLGVDFDSYLAIPRQQRDHMNEWLRYNKGSSVADYQAAFSAGSAARRKAVSAAANDKSETDSAENFGIPLQIYRDMSANERKRVKGWLKADASRTFDDYLHSKKRGRNSEETAAHYGIPLDLYLEMPDQVRRRTKKWLRENPGKTFEDYRSRTAT